MAAASITSSGMNLGYSAVALPLMDLDDEDENWFASVASIATSFGCLVAGPTLDALGRRYTIILVNVPFILGFTVLCAVPYDTPLWALFIGRVLTGLGSGMASLPATVYIAEMATSRMRPMLVTWPSIFISIGILLVYLFGYLTSDWRIVAGICLAFPIITGLVEFLFLKESPTWLISRDRIEEAESSLMWVRGVAEMTPELKQEHEAIVTNVTSLGTDNLTFMEKLKLYKNAECWKPLLILNVYFFFMQLSGVYVLIFYAVGIVKSAGVTIDEFLAAVLLGVFQLLAGVVASYVLNRCGRRPMSFFSGILMSITMLGLGVYMEVSEDTSLSWVPLTLIIIFIGAAAAGFNTIPWAMLGEIFPARVRGLSGGVTTCLSYTFSFIAITLYPGGTAGIFFLYGSSAAVATVFLFFFLPETFGKTLDQISEEFRRPGLGHLHFYRSKKSVS
ncbi:hypothetical protein L9F63_015880 [Diploptera punctata]|uniref:Major facilitator superfamily (MFS) profile domain-containing protein n=1 Tax=Diploptera punctata TaxID=6984 RepID=A0AAD8A4R3_DIPPU|nr:hypothetical protein L9F63_015880 [Diploptera punctata]